MSYTLCLWACSLHHQAQSLRSSRLSVMLLVLYLKGCCSCQGHTNLLLSVYSSIVPALIGVGLTHFALFCTWHKVKVKILFAMHCPVWLVSFAVNLLDSFSPFWTLIMKVRLYSWTLNSVLALSVHWLAIATLTQHCRLVVYNRTISHISGGHKSKVKVWSLLIFTLLSMWSGHSSLWCLMAFSFGRVLISLL